MKKLAAALIIVLTILTSAVILPGCTGSNPKFKTDKVVVGDIVSSVTATGTVNAVTMVLVGTQASGTIKDIYADFNSSVKKGQLIALIDPAAFEAQAEQAKANLLSAEANLDKAAAALIDAKRTLDRSRDLFSKNLIAKSEVDTAETNHETAKAQVNVSRAQVSIAEASLRTAMTNLGYTRILSPVDGIVVSRNVDVGQTVAASFQTPTLFTIAKDLTKMQIDTNVDEADIGKIKLGQQVDFTVDAYPDTSFKGSVWQVRNAPITSQNVVSYDVVIKVDNKELKLKPGMTANVSIIISSKKDVLKVPNAALRFRYSEAATGPQQKGFGVWTVKDGKPKRIPVRIGISDGNFTEIITDALAKGQEVITDSLTRPGKTAPSPRMF